MTTVRIFTTTFANPTVAKIERFANLTPGWNYSAGVAPSGETIAEALQINDALQVSGFLETDAFPGTDGEIQVVGYNGTLYAECTLKPDHTVTFALEKDSQELQFLENISLSQTLHQLEFLRNQTWASFGLSLQINTTKNSGVLQALHSAKEAASVFRLWMQNVPTKQRTPSVPTWYASTKSPTTSAQLSFGSSPKQASPQDVPLFSKQVQQATNAITI